MEWLDAIATYHELRSQLIQQFGMAGEFASRSEVVRSSYQARSEMPLKNAIDQNTGCQGMDCDPVRQFPSTAG